MIFWGKNSSFCDFKKKSQATWSMELLGKIPQMSSHFQDLFFEIAKIFVGIGQISNFLLLKLPSLVNRF